MKKFLFYSLIFAVLSVPFGTGILLGLDEGKLQLIIMVSSIFVLVLHVPVIKDFTVWGFSVNLRNEIKKAEVTIKYLKEVLVPLVEELYISKTDQGRFVDVITDDSDLPIAHLAKKLEIYDTQPIVKSRFRMYNLGKFDAFYNIGVKKSTDLKEEDSSEISKYKKLIDDFSSRYDPSNFIFPSIKELDDFYSVISESKIVNHESFENCKRVFIIQDSLLSRLGDKDQ